MMTLTIFHKNTFDIAVIEDTTVAHFLDWGSGFNGRIMESMDIRYGIDSFFLNQPFNPHEYHAYSPFELPIPIVKLDISADTDFEMIVLKTEIPNLLTNESAVLEVSMNSGDEIIMDKGFLLRKHEDTLWQDYPVFDSVFSICVQGLLPDTEYEVYAYANTALNNHYTGEIVKF